VDLAIDCASDEPGLALSAHGSGVAALTLTWSTERNHSVELLPNIERLLEEAKRERSDLEAIFVDIGPGGYAALRVGVSIAKALAHALEVPLVGIGRLELDAYSVAEHAGESRILAVHRAGRGELAWAAYTAQRSTWTEMSAPAIVKADAFESSIASGDALTGDIDDALAAAAQRAGATVLSSPHHRVAALTRVGARRLAEGRVDDPAALVPLYLRAPAIGPQG
jgi:tRNA threonylcarbamoyl adenosine modification protein YeaZ